MFETAVVDEPSVFEPPKFYCIIKRSIKGALEKRANHEKVFNISFDAYSRTSMARTLMARLPRLFRTRS